MRRKRQVNHRFLRLAAILVASAISFSLSAQDEVRVLFLGNSYTATNSLPTLFKNLAISEGKSVYCDVVAPGGHGFYSHAYEPEQVSKIEQGNWDVIVIQGQSQEAAFPDGQFYWSVYPSARAADSVAKLHNPQARVMFFMTWGYRYGDPSNCYFYDEFCTFTSMTHRLKHNYLVMASDFGSEVCPVGAAWYNSWENDSTVVLHSGDNSHPALNGSYLAACCFYESIFKERLENAAYPSGVSAANAAFLQECANRVVYDSLSYWNFSQTAGICESGVKSETVDFKPLANEEGVKLITSGITGQTTIEVITPEGRLISKTDRNIQLNEAFTLPFDSYSGVAIVKLTTKEGIISRKTLVR